MNKNICSQCPNKEAIAQKDGHLLCLNCYERAQKIDTDIIRNLKSLYESNRQAINQFDIIAGIAPSFERPIMQQKVINNNFNNNTIGVLNFGTISDSLKNIATFFDYGNKHTELQKCSSKVKKFADQVIKAPDASNEQKEKILEYLSTITDEILKPNNTRKKSLINILLSSITSIATTINSLTIIWDLTQKIIQMC